MSELFNGLIIGLLTNLMYDILKVGFQKFKREVRVKHKKKKVEWEVYVDFVWSFDRYNYLSDSKEITFWEKRISDVIVTYLQSKFYTFIATHFTLIYLSIMYL